MNKRLQGDEEIGREENKRKQMDEEDLFLNFKF